MSDHSWFRLLARGIGLLLVGMALPSLLQHTGFALQGVLTGDIFVQAQYLLGVGGEFLGRIAQFALGIYLLRGGGQLIGRCIESLAGVCPACGYNVRGVPGTVCPECGCPLPAAPGRSGSSKSESREAP